VWNPGFFSVRCPKKKREDKEVHSQGNRESRVACRELIKEMGGEIQSRVGHQAWVQLEIQRRDAEGQYWGATATGEGETGEAV